MRLKTLKLAGFKSFVDPTTVPFPSNLVGVIGPNGCGKSNIIDAVRWVMGESSAKQLRGDSMSDVIFNGSSSRKPVGHASVELIFDNADGKLQGQYSSFSEISVKRKGSRDGKSSYYLNGTKCRRRDIMDLFLGTGLGPRSYAIIEQGMISRFVEAKPDDLRVLIEEAAGISKYKERRRETETRMRHTRENLDRINDLREELGKQLRRLERQSQTAKRYRKLKEEERLLQAELLALRWRDYDEQASKQDKIARQAELAVQQKIAKQRGVEADIEKSREKHSESNDSFNKIQGRFYEVGAEIARTEQNLKGMRERRSQLESDLQKVEESWHEANAMMKSDQQRIIELEENLKRDEPEWKKLTEEDAVFSREWESAENAWHEWQSEFEEFNRSANDPTRDAEISRSQIEQLERQQQSGRNQQQRLHDEQKLLPVVDINSLLEESKTLEKGELELQQQRDNLRNLRGSITAQREEVRKFSEQQNSERSELQRLRGKLTSLEALQQDALGRDKSGIKNWLQQSGMADAPRLAELLTVEPGWEQALETVLGDYLEAVSVNSDSELLQSSSKLKKGMVSFIQGSAQSADSSASSLEQITEIELTGATPLTSLLSEDSVIKMGSGVDELLQGVYGVENLELALELRSQLRAGASLVTKNGGVWIGHNWSQIVREDDRAEGVLQREQSIRDLKQRQQELEAALEVLAAKINLANNSQKEQEQKLEQEQRELEQRASKIGTAKAQLSGKQARQEQADQRRGSIAVELHRINSDEKEAEESIHILRAKLEVALEAMQESESKRDKMDSHKIVLRENMDRARDSAREKRDQLHKITVEIESSRTRLESTRNGLVRMEEQLASSEKRKIEISADRENIKEPITALKQELEGELAKQLLVENELMDARRQLEEIEHKLREMDGERIGIEREVQDLRVVHEKRVLDKQEIHVRRQTLDEQLQESGYGRDTLLRTLDADITEERGRATVGRWQQLVSDIEQKITRLGPINLAAIEEYQSESERKTYLDEQNDDLLEALKILEDAIAKIDRETRSRFKDTFEKINDGLKANFPKLFGGGRAHLEMTGDDLLDTGVTIMAQPPGKRNSTIHLLSGGEKALTAVALVFSIFELNPAPFCMLDEVDAPLDEANVGRFCNMVKLMSDRVQFIFITHNKETMEISDQLSGVTMHEPGVSRMVSVDIEEAQAMVRS